MIRHPVQVQALQALPVDLRRDQWGYLLSLEQLDQIAHYVLDPNISGVTDEEMADLLGMALLTEALPPLASGYDTPADDEQLLTIVQTIREAS